MLLRLDYLDSAYPSRRIIDIITTSCGPLCKHIFHCSLSKVGRCCLTPSFAHEFHYLSRVTFPCSHSSGRFECSISGNQTSVINKLSTAEESSPASATSRIYVSRFGHPFTISKVGKLCRCTSFIGSLALIVLRKNDHIKVLKFAD